MFNRRLAGLSLLLPLLGACVSTPTAEQEQELGITDFKEEVAEVSQPGSVYCIFLRAELATRSDIPELIQCNDDSNASTGQEGIVVAFSDPAKFSAENNIGITPEFVFAPLDAMASAFDQLGAQQLASVDLFLVFFDDLCGNTWEVQPTTLAKLGAGLVTLDQAMDEVAIFSAPDCP